MAYHLQKISSKVTLMKFVILLCDAPEAPSSRRALRFAQAVLASGHELTKVFSYQEGVRNASTAAVYPQDEANIVADWQSFIQQNQLEALVCIAAALRRGVLDDAEAQRHNQAPVLAAGWALSGLGQFHEAIQEADRLVCFGGP